MSSIAETGQSNDIGHDAHVESGQWSINDAEATVYVADEAEVADNVAYDNKPVASVNPPWWRKKMDALENLVGPPVRRIRGRRRPVGDRGPGRYSNNK